MTNEVTIRIGGESGEGTISGGDILALASARWGYHVYTFRTFPAEILGGPCLFQVRIGDHPVNSMGDYADVLICLNQEAYDRNVSDLRQGGVVIYDPSDFTPDTNNFITYPIPFNEIARKEVQLFQTKNMVMLGAISGLFGPELEAITEVVESKLSKSRKANPLLMEKNLLALQVSQKYVTEQISKRDSYRLGPVDKANRVVLNGNQAVVAGALAAQCRYFAGYPITPASDIMEAMAKELPLVGGTFLQAEDEMAALASVLGASFGGLRAMTATSGPGFSLMTELIGLASMTELPVVIVDAQRAGPSTGMPTKMEQSDLSFALHSGHGDTPRMIVAPADIGIIGWGSTEGAIQEAVDRAREQGYKVASLHPKILSPLPDRTIRDFIRSAKKVIVPECNYSGQLANLLGAKYGLQAVRVNKFGGIPFTAGEILRSIEEVS